MGAPGAGKGTQSEKIVEKFNIPHISTGEIFRFNIKNETELGLLAKQYTDAGKLVPDEVTNAMVKDRLQNDDVQAGFLLDGYPRTINQAQALKSILDDLGKKIDLVLNINTDKSLLMDRLTGRRVCKVCGSSYHLIFNPSKVENICDKDGGELIQRSDDNAEKVGVRLEAYEKQTKPLIEFYENDGQLVNIDGNGKIDAIFEEVVRIINT